MDGEDTQLTGRDKLKNNQRKHPGARGAGVCACLVTQSCPTLCHPVDCCLPGSSVPGTFRARMEWVAISFSREAINPGIKPESLVSPALAGVLFTIVLPGKPLEVRGGRRMQKC